MIIRDFNYTDLDDLIQVAQVSFAEDFEAQGMSIDNFARQIRLLTRGRMIPFKIVNMVARVKWGIFVAEVDNKIVGCGGYIGQNQHIHLANLMVDPEYRRRGIGQKLLIKRLDYLKSLGYPFVATTILNTNQASLGNVHKQNFEVFDQYSIFEIPLAELKKVPRPSDIRVRDTQGTDQPRFSSLEEAVINPNFLQINGSYRDIYFPSFGTRVSRKFNGVQSCAYTVEQNGQIAGFLVANTSKNKIKGAISRPIMAKEHQDFLPVGIGAAASWLTSLGKTTIQISVPADHMQLIAYLESTGWTKLHTWVQLVKWFHSPSGQINAIKDPQN